MESCRLWDHAQASTGAWTILVSAKDHANRSLENSLLVVQIRQNCDDHCEPSLSMKWWESWDCHVQLTVNFAERELWRPADTCWVKSVSSSLQRDAPLVHRSTPDWQHANHWHVNQTTAWKETYYYKWLTFDLLRTLHVFTTLVFVSSVYRNGRVKLCDWFFLSAPNLRDAATEIGEIVTDICRMAASFIKWS